MDNVAEKQKILTLMHRGWIKPVYDCTCQKNIHKHNPFHPAEGIDRARPSTVHNSNKQCSCDNDLNERLMFTSDSAEAAQLIKQGANVNYRDYAGCTPLHSSQDVEITALLIENGANVNYANFYGDTPLHYSRTAEIAACLIDNGADIHSRNIDGDTPLHKLMFIYREKPREVICQCVAVMIERGANIDAVNYYGQTPLHKAVQEEMLELISTLLYYNADTSIRDSRGDTPLMYNIMLRKSQDASQRLIYEMLLGYEDNFTCSVNDDLTLLTLALVRQSPYLDEMISLGVDFSNLQHDLSILFWCIHQPDIEEFKWFWNIFDYKKSWIYCNSILEFLLNMEKYSAFDYVLESPKLKDVIEVQKRITYGRLYLSDYDSVGFSSMTGTPHYNICRDEMDITISAVLHGTECNDYNKCKAEQAIFVLLSHGRVASEYDAYRIFDLYGYGPLFELLLHVGVREVKYMKPKPPPLLAKVLLNPGIDARKYFVSQREEEEEVEEAEEIEEEEVEEDEEMEVEEDEEAEEIEEEEVEEAKKIKGAYVSDREVIFMGKGVPSLLELSRNQARVAIWNKYNIQNIKQFYTTVKWMVIPPLIKDILNFKVPIYDPREN